MSFQDTLNQINLFCAHENTAIAEFAQKAVYYGQALQNNEVSIEEFQTLMGDIESLRSMCRCADEQIQVAKIYQGVMMLPALI